MAAMASEEELANLQKLSNDYVPDVQVGEWGMGLQTIVSDRIIRETL